MFAIIMAGGSGTRLWPLSRRRTPKQLLALTGDTSLLQQTVARLGAILKPHDIYVITSQAHVRPTQRRCGGRAASCRGHASIPPDRRERVGKQGPEFFPSPCFTAEQRISHAAGDARGGATGIAAVVGATSGKRVARGHIGDDLHIESEGILDVFDGGCYGHDCLSSLPDRFLLIRPETVMPQRSKHEPVV